MSIVNFSVPAPLEKQIKKVIREKGFATRAEFFRFAALYALGAFGQPLTTDEYIREGRRDYENGNYKSVRSAKTLIKELKK